MFFLHLDSFSYSDITWSSFIQSYLATTIDCRIFHCVYVPSLTQPVLQQRVFGFYLIVFCYQKKKKKKSYILILFYILVCVYVRAFLQDILGLEYVYVNFSQIFNFYMSRIYVSAICTFTFWQTLPNFSVKMLLEERMGRM